MSGVESHSKAANCLSDLLELTQFEYHRRTLGIATLGVKGVGVGPGVDLAYHRADARRSFGLPQIGVDEYRNHDAGRAQAHDRFPQFCLPGDDVQPAFGSDLVAPLWHE